MTASGWVITTEEYLHDIQRQIQALTEDLPVEVLLVRRSREPRHCSSWAVMAARSPLMTASGWVTGTSRVSTALSRYSPGAGGRRLRAHPLQRLAAAAEL
jgi:hypothetical protein